jgi:hypothetical protein
MAPHYDANNFYVNDPEDHPTAQAAPVVYGTTTTLAEFLVESAMELLVTLQVCAFLRTALTGANNDLDVIAKAPGTGGLAIGLALVDPAANNQALAVSVGRFLTTAQGSNKDLAFTAKNPADDVTIAYVVGGAGAALSVDVAAKAITVNVKTTDPGDAADSTASEIKAAIEAKAEAAALIRVDLALGSSGAGKPTAMGVTHITKTLISVSLATGSGGAITSTAAQVLAAINANAAANVLVTAMNAASNSGAGVVTALSPTNLGDVQGSSPTIDCKLQTSGDGTNFYDLGSAFTQLAAVGSQELAFTGLGLKAKYVVTIGGSATPLAAVGFHAQFRRH